VEVGNLDGVDFVIVVGLRGFIRFWSESPYYGWVSG